MAPQAFEIKQNDLLPLLEGTVRREDGNGPYDLATVASVDFFMRASGAAVPLISGVGTVTNASLGQLAFCWNSGETATIGYYEAEFQFNYAGGKTQTVPRRGYLPVRIVDDIG